jgi:hypothetical protein
MGPGLGHIWHLSPRLESVAKALPPGPGFLVAVPIKHVGEQHALCVRE